MKSSTFEPGLTIPTSVSIKHGLRTTGYGLRTGYKTRTQVYDSTMIGCFERSTVERLLRRIRTTCPAVYLYDKHIIRLLHMELANSENHHKPHNIKPRFNNYSIYKKYIYNSQSEQTQINLISQLKSENLNFDLLLWRVVTTAVFYGLAES